MVFKEGGYKFIHYKEYISFLLDNHIEEVADQYLKISEEIAPGWFEWFPDRENFKLSAKTRLIDFFQSVKEDRALEHSKAIVSKWKENNIPELQDRKLSSDDILNSITVRRLTIFCFIDKYTGDIALVQKIYREAEHFYGIVTKYTLDVFLSLFQHELQRTNEELKSSHEELETTNEELRNSEEELQAVNEELREQIRQRVHSEEIREKENQYLQTILENISDGIVACDENGMLSFFNRATREFHCVEEKPIPHTEWSSYYNLFLVFPEFFINCLKFFLFFLQLGVDYFKAFIVFFKLHFRFPSCGNVVHHYHCP